MSKGARRPDRGRKKQNPPPDSHIKIGGPEIVLRGHHLTLAIVAILILPPLLALAKWLLTPLVG